MDGFEGVGFWRGGGRGGAVVVFVFVIVSLIAATEGGRRRRRKGEGRECWAEEWLVSCRGGGCSCGSVEAKEAWGEGDGAGGAVVAGEGEGWD